MNVRSMILKGSLVLSILAANNYAQIGLIINRNLSDSISSSISTLIDDIENIEGKTVWVNDTQFTSSSSADELRTALKSRFDNFGLEGVIFIGDLPIAQYEIEDDYYTYGYADFPIDLYYMDLDGNWLDTATSGMWSGNAQDGVFDGHNDGYGDMLAEIWVSRITGSIISGLGSEAQIINQYLARAHSRMTGNDGLDEKMVICGYDTDWPSCVSWAGADLLKYDSAKVTTYLRSYPAATQDSKDNWMSALRAGNESAALFEHSGPNTNHVVNLFTSNDYINMDSTGGISNVRFYNLYACSNCRYTVTDVLGGLYAWGHNGLIAVGSTKTGSMLNFDGYNTDLGNGVSFGNALLNWLNANVMPYTSNSTVSWHFGMTLLGLGTLHQQKYDSHQGNGDVMGFEDVSKWGLIWGSQGTLSQNSNHTEGSSSMQITGNGWQQLKSIDLNTEDLPSVQNKLALDLFVGSTQPNPWYLGEVQLLINCPSANVYNQFIGNVQLSSLVRGSFNTVTFVLPQNIKNIISGSYIDFSFSLVLNTNSGSGPYYFDNMRFTD